jgi:hypothetical protein
MQAKQHVLIAAQPAAAAVLKAMLSELVELTTVHTVADGLVALRSERDRITLIISTIAFDESRMLEFLVAVKANAEINAIPVLCCRILPTVLSQHTMERLGEMCTNLGATDFVDFATLGQTYGTEAAQVQFKNAVMKATR